MTKKVKPKRGILLVSIVASDSAIQSSHRFDILYSTSRITKSQNTSSRSQAFLIPPPHPGVCLPIICLYCTTPHTSSIHPPPHPEPAIIQLNTTPPPPGTTNTKKPTALSPTPLWEWVTSRQKPPRLLRLLACFNPGTPLFPIQVCLCTNPSKVFPFPGSTARACLPGFPSPVIIKITPKKGPSMYIPNQKTKEKIADCSCSSSEEKNKERGCSGARLRYSVWCLCV